MFSIHRETGSTRTKRTENTSRMPFCLSVGKRSCGEGVVVYIRDSVVVVSGYDMTRGTGSSLPLFSPSSMEAWRHLAFRINQSGPAARRWCVPLCVHGCRKCYLGALFFRRRCHQMLHPSATVAARVHAEQHGSGIFEWYSASFDVYSRVLNVSLTRHAVFVEWPTTL